MQGGVIFAISKTVFRFRHSILEYNMATDGGIVYGMSNQILDANSIQLRYLNIFKEDGSL